MLHFTCSLVWIQVCLQMVIDYWTEVFGELIKLLIMGSLRKQMGANE
jgi:hypothetical protein